MTDDEMQPIMDRLAAWAADLLPIINEAFNQGLLESAEL